MIFTDLNAWRVRIIADGLFSRTPGSDSAAKRVVRQIRGNSLKGRKILDRPSYAGNSLEQSDRIGMRRSREYLSNLPYLCYLSPVHNQNPITNISDNRDIVSNE